MKREIIYLFTAALLICGAETSNAQKKDEGGVTIGGVTWATSNVGAKGKFVKNPWDTGRYYSFDDAQSACPAGWRTPSAMEFEALITAGSEWTTENKVNGRRFGKGENTIFLPAVGGHYTYQKELSDVGGSGYYWSSIPYSDDLDYNRHLEHNSDLAYDLRFSAGSAHLIYHNNRSFGFPVRCVKDIKK